MRGLTSLGILLAAVASCSETKMCPTIGCLPRIDLTFRTPVTGAYRPVVMLNVSSFVENCPTVRLDLAAMPGIASCDQNGMTLTGVDLGHEDNFVIFATVAIDGMNFLNATAGLVQITNSRDCDLVCYQHMGIIEN